MRHGGVFSCKSLCIGRDVTFWEQVHQAIGVYKASLSGKSLVSLALSRVAVGGAPQALTWAFPASSHWPSRQQQTGSCVSSLGTTQRHLLPHAQLFNDHLWLLLLHCRAGWGGRDRDHTACNPNVFPLGPLKKVVANPCFRLCSW